MTPYDWQHDIIGALRTELKNTNRVCVQLATGGGKTVIFSYIAVKSAENGHHVRIVVHRVEILQQTIKKLAAFGIDVAIIGVTPGWQTAPIAVGMVITCQKHGLGKCDIIIVDEAHHTNATSWADVLSRYPSCLCVGLTATPKRLDGKGLDDHYDTLVQGPTVDWLTEKGYLAPINAWADRFAIVSGVRSINNKTPEAEIDELLEDFTENAIDTWLEKAEGQQTIGFCASRLHAEYTAKKFQARGIKAASVDGTMSQKKRESAMELYEVGVTQVLLNCELISEGFDVPETSCVMQLRSTDSLTMHFQHIGRGMRAKANGGECTLLDMACNIMGTSGDNGLGLPSDVVEWSLQGNVTTKQDQEAEREAQEKKEKEANAVIEASGDIIRIPTKLEECTNFAQAKRFLTQPDDFNKIKKHCRTKTGKMYSDAFLLRTSAEMFYKDRPLHDGLRQSAKAMGKSLAYVNRAIDGGWEWTRDRNDQTKAEFSIAG